MISRIAFPLYRTVPIFGRLRAALGIIRNGERVLVVRRNDGRGLCFPGGLAYPWESDESALVREVEEETGLRPQTFRFAFRYDSNNEIPVRIAVFHIQVDRAPEPHAAGDSAPSAGELRASWEGTPEWIKAADIGDRILPSQEEIVAWLLRQANAT